MTTDGAGWTTFGGFTPEELAYIKGPPMGPEYHGDTGARLTGEQLAYLNSAYEREDSVRPRFSEREIEYIKNGPVPEHEPDFFSWAFRVGFGGLVTLLAWSVYRVTSDFRNF